MNYKKCIVELRDNHSPQCFKFITVLSEKEISSVASGDTAPVFERIMAEACLLHKLREYTIIGIFVQCERYIYHVR